MVQISTFCPTSLRHQGDDGHLYFNDHMVIGLAAHNRYRPAETAAVWNSLREDPECTKVPVEEVPKCVLDRLVVVRTTGHKIKLFDEDKPWWKIPLAKVLPNPQVSACACFSGSMHSMFSGSMPQQQA